MFKSFGLIQTRLYTVILDTKISQDLGILVSISGSGIGLGGVCQLKPELRDC